ncbi:predicted RNA-binding protein of the translin family [Chthonomonas calidirosea]|uniref:hypothetical protein n=1 Tax=Chthonomonas calidirosea TaxID=454171 RepID=UPI0006DD4580|nr:hypothetical protein [Chthonomonas calidirosea]CEK16480.1 predicted RNA-binding protein of the translin family [Chthonomonas calidirosea]
MDYSVLLETVGQRLRADFEAKNQAREETLRLCREIIQYTSRATRAVHRKEFDVTKQLIQEAREKLFAAHALLKPYPDLFYSGYIHDAQKEYVEAEAMLAIVMEAPLPTPEELGVESAAYLHGLAEAASESRRYLLDSLRRDQLDIASRVLDSMEAIYDLLITFDFPDALTEGLRRAVDNLRAVLERSRADLTLTFIQNRLRSSLEQSLQNGLGTQSTET